MRDIVERLREMGKGFKGYPSGCTETLLIREAADEIERLQAERDAAIDLYHGEGENRLSIARSHEKYVAENAKLQAVVDAARDFVNNHMDHDDAMRIFDALAALEDDNE